MNIYFLSDQINICHIFAEQLSEHQSFVFASSELFFKSITSSQDYPDLLIFDYWLYNHDTFNLFDYMNDLNVNIPHIYFNDPCPLFNNRELHWNYIMANFYGFQYEKNKNEYCSLFSKLYNLVEKSEITPYLELIQDRTIFPNALWIIPCFLCGRDGKFECNRCNETGKVSEEINCTSCSGSGVSGTTTCTACNGTGGELHWSPEPNAKGTSEAVAVRAKTMKLNLSGIGTGDIFYPYLKNNITYNTSIDQKVKFFAVPRPTNIREDKFTYVLAFETSSNNDYKDIIFLVVSDKRFESVPTNPLFTSIRKRYLIEDLCSSSDFDFNDIVVDVEQIKAYERTGNNGNYGFKSNTTQTATLKHVCGTVPFEVYIGSKKLFAVTDPTDKQKMAQELNCSVTDAAVDGFDLDAVAEDIKTWNPANNNIRIKVWKNSQPGAESYEGAEFVNSSFPQQGTVPFIIATDVSVAWTAKDGDRFDINKLK